ncbi:hypothetical protein ANRL4_01408 [Anaerolineae bacterium]|nr:hypothetical protein ANRL4_01408 [Anaerolineae bacterium]
MTDVFRIVYTQTLIGDDANRLSETRPEIYFQIGYAAIETRWLRGFQRRWADLGALVGLGLHARPLLGADYELLRGMGLVGPEDEGRLYARLTDLGLAEATGIDRKDGIPACTQRLAESRLLKVLNLPDDFRDSYGQFSGRHAYLLLGSVVSQSNHRGGLPPMVKIGRGGLSPTVDGRNGLSRGGLSPIKNITLSSTLSKNESGARGAPAAIDSVSKTGRAPDDEHAGDRPTLDQSGNAIGVDHTEDAAQTASGAHRPQGTIWQRLNAALEDENTAHAFEPMLGEIEAKLGFTEIGLRAARLAFAPLPDRRRRVLDDLRRMQGNTTLKPHTRQRNVIGILTQNIGVTLGMGLTGDGSLRALADRDDYTSVGGLVKEYGAEPVWLKACEIAGQGFEGDPLDYLRAALHNKRERDKAVLPPGSCQRSPNGRSSFDEIDYSKEEVGV